MQPGLLLELHVGWVPRHRGPRPETLWPASRDTVACDSRHCVLLKWQLMHCIAYLHTATRGIALPYNAEHGTESELTSRCLTLQHVGLRSPTMRNMVRGVSWHLTEAALWQNFIPSTPRVSAIDLPLKMASGFTVKTAEASRLIKSFWK